MTDSNINQLKALKQKLSNQEMSVLIGAGFSKNISDIFPSWWQLLFDLTYFLFKDDIEQSYIGLPSKNRKNKSDYINQRVDHYIKKLGFLEIASEYIKRKGFVESITTYIEEKTPRLIQENDKYFLTNILDQKKNKVELTAAMLSQHRALIRLPWNNIYTTNYDEMLEFANKTNSEQSINNEIQNLQNEISELEQTAINIQRDINDDINAIQNPKEELLPGMDIPRGSNLNSSTRKDRRQLEYDLSEVKKIISSKERDLIDFNKALGDCISVVTDSSELSVKRNKNIIKLHGTLRADENPFGFDGDVRKHYIISKEDFHTYPQKHEAFTQLMRISLLQESYCLIGFSGVDPNFIEWVKWVRDILERKRNIDPQNQYKIFLISLDNKEPDEDEKLFYRNYKVYRLPIANENVINFLEEQTSIKVENRESKKEILETFFNYLSLEINVSSPQFTIDKINLNKYDKVWESIKITNPYNIRVTDYASQMNELTMFKKHSRIPAVNNLYAQNKHLLINFAKNIIEKNKEHSELLIRVSILAMRDLFVIPSFVWENDDIKYISALASKNSDIKKELNLFFLRDAVLSNDTTSFNRIKKTLDGSEDRVIYEEILKCAFNLDFKNLRKKLNDWNASSHWLLKKAGFVALFDLNEAEKLIESYHFSESESVHEQIHFYQIFKFIRVSNLSHDEKLNRKITALKKLGLSDLD
ncbi:MAG: SIR2 family protein, partial [Cytophaga sp.]|uniref:SIR2 family protein n=1 Tax=Cytophaga sp. TaxID=29535 RepID=UPI003F7D8CB8